MASAVRWISALVLVLAAALGGMGMWLSVHQTQVYRQARLDATRSDGHRLAAVLRDNLHDHLHGVLTEAEQQYLQNGSAGLEQVQRTTPCSEGLILFHDDHLLAVPADGTWAVRREASAFLPPAYREGEARERSGQLQEAVASYSQCLGDDQPADVQVRAWRNIAACLLRMGQYRQAADAYETLLNDFAEVLASTRGPTPVAIHVAWLEAKSRAGDADVAEQADDLYGEVLAGRVRLFGEQDQGLVLWALERWTKLSRGDLARAEGNLQAALDQQRQEEAYFRWLLSRLRDEAALMGGDRGPEMRPLHREVRGGHRVLVYQPLRQAGHGFVGTLLRLDRVRQRFVTEPLSAAGQQAWELNEAPAASPTPGWSQPISSLLPFWSLRPTEEHLRSIARAGGWQNIIFASLTALMLLVLLGAIWMLARSVRRQVALSELKASFAANVSHELKTPLSLIRLFADTLLHGRVSDPERVREYCGTITRESERLTHLINNILDFSRLSSGQKRYHLTSCDLAEIVRTTYETYRLQLEHGGFDHRLQIGDDLPAVQCDPAAIAQALVNLLNNAVKYSDGQRYVGVSVERTSLGARAAVAIAVSDRGIGIPPEDRLHLFEEFYRGQSDDVRATRGAGLGLCLVKDIVDAHQGVIRVHSVPGEGSTFQIVLPAESDESPPAEPG